LKGIRIKNRDIVALVTLISCTYLIACGRDSIVGYSLLGVVCGYFGIEIIPPRIGRKKKGGK
jgi:hypothetical protein